MKIRGRRKILLMAALLAMLPSSLTGCGSGNSTPADEGDSTEFFSPYDYGDAIDEAQEAADQAERRAREAEEELERQMEGWP